MVMKMDAGLDTGDVALVERAAIRPRRPPAICMTACRRLGADLMVRAMAALERGELHLTRRRETA